MPPRPKVVIDCAIGSSNDDDGMLADDAALLPDLDALGISPDLHGPADGRGIDGVLVRRKLIHWINF